MAHAIQYKYDRRKFNPSPEYARMITTRDIPVDDIAIGLGISERTIYNWRNTGFPSYLHQYACEDYVMERLGLSRDQLEDQK